MKYVIGNWKMNGAAELLEGFLKLKEKAVLCVPFHLLRPGTDMVGIGAEDCSAHESGAFTGEVSARMIAEAGAKYCIVGHSERRQYWNETNEIVAAKAARCLEYGLIPIICVGETKEQKKAGETLKVIESQVWQSIPSVDIIKSEIIVAYEPVWAIGTGLIPTIDDITSVHNHIAEILKQMGLAGTAVLYGGSVKPSNAREIMGIKNVGGVLVGGASLKLDDFIPIIKAA
ncbi:MAG: triose-phosphate isomerase [Rickettsiales bacterium]|jgi:triosephosphate isomerase|nr:triose-phosphate isomerase [Rickettsiales bacterium]